MKSGSFSSLSREYSEVYTEFETALAFTFGNKNRRSSDSVVAGERLW